MVRLAKQYGRYGYRKIATLLRVEGWQVNHKKVERLWREEGLQIPQRHRKRKRLYHKNSSVIRLRPTYQNHIWSIDFVHDKLANGRPYKMLTVLDEYSREALCVAVKPRMGNAEVLEALYPLFLKHGRPEFIRSDQRQELLTHMRPLSHTDGHDRFGLVDEFVPGLATGLDDGVVIFEDAVGEPILAHVLPDVLDRVQLG